MLEDGFVVVDCETTGLDPARDAIIQVALLKWTPQGIDKLDFFVNPQRGIPELIRSLTGFRDIDFTQYPRFSAVARDIEHFVGNYCIVGHNVGFDLQFLEAAGLPLVQETVDTLEWAPIALPLAPSYRLSELVDSVPIGQFHDARADVEATLQLVMLIRQRLGLLPPNTARDLSYLMGEDWSWWQVPTRHETSPPLSTRENERNGTDALPIWSHAYTADGWLGPQGPVAKTLPGFESRTSQLAMVEAIEQAFDQQAILMVEAGTGTGKSLAYLTPTLLEVGARGVRAVVATHTLALQEQLWSKDLPLALQDSPVQTAVLKGRGRYLCLLKLDEQKQDVTVLNSARRERLALSEVLTFAHWSQNGDIDEFNPRTEITRRLWQDLVAEKNACAGPRCAFAGPCFLRQSKRLADAAHIVVVNHALLATHLVKGGVLPPFTHLVIDEAHQFAEVVERTLGLDLGIAEFAHQFQELDQGRHGIFQRLSHHSELDTGVESVRHHMRISVELMWQLNHQLLADCPADLQSRGAVRVTASLWDEWQARAISRVLAAVHQSLADAVRAGYDVLAQAEALLGDVVHEEVSWLRYSKWVGDMKDLTIQIGEWGIPKEDWVSWWEVARSKPEQSVKLRRSPIDVAKFLQTELWDTLESAVVTSATLSIEGDFGYYHRRLGIPAARLQTLSLPTPFDVPHKAQLLIPNDMPKVNEAMYSQAVSNFCYEAVCALDGRTLVLFTSHRMLQEVSQTLREQLLERHIQVLAQGIDGTGPRLVDQFRRQSRAVLMGAASLWEGVDIPGPQLSLVVIVRLPFANPTDPMEEARRERMESQNKSAFYQLALPKALLRFKQGFGRLLRTSEDRGAVAVLDARILPTQTQYGRRFVKAVPGPSILTGSQAYILEAIKQMGEELFT